ncbi:MAG: DUF1249 domain-containing protein [Lysobacterales bacterium]|jgi:uncharacterized protein YqiB (DUF1249 family)
MVSFRQKHGLCFKPALKRLQEVQGEIYQRMMLLIPEHVSFYDSFQSHVQHSPLLKMDVLERHPYTHFLRLTYQFEHADGNEIAPDAHIRLYKDARLAEATSFNPLQGCQRVAHPSLPHQYLLQRSWRLNLALHKWLDYLLQQGHNVASMRPVSDGIRGGEALPIVEALG